MIMLPPDGLSISAKWRLAWARGVTVKARCARMTSTVFGNSRFDKTWVCVSVCVQVHTTEPKTQCNGWEIIACVYRYARALVRDARALVCSPADLTGGKSCTETTQTYVASSKQGHALRPEVGDHKAAEGPPSTLGTAAEALGESSNRRRLSCSRRKRVLHHLHRGAVGGPCMGGAEAIQSGGSTSAAPRSGARAVGRALGLPQLIST